MIFLKDISLKIHPLFFFLLFPVEFLSLSLFILFEHFFVTTFSFWPHGVKKPGDWRSSGPRRSTIFSPMPFDLSKLPETLAPWAGVNGDLYERLYQRYRPKWFLPVCRHGAFKRFAEDPFPTDPSTWHPPDLDTPNF